MSRAHLGTPANDTPSGTSAHCRSEQMPNVKSTSEAPEPDAADAASQRWLAEGAAGMVWLGRRQAGPTTRLALLLNGRPRTALAITLAAQPL